MLRWMSRWHRCFNWYTYWPEIHILPTFVRALPASIFHGTSTKLNRGRSNTVMPDGRCRKQHNCSGSKTVHTFTLKMYHTVAEGNQQPGWGGMHSPDESGTKPAPPAPSSMRKLIAANLLLYWDDVHTVLYEGDNFLTNDWNVFYVNAKQGSIYKVKKTF